MAFAITSLVLIVAGDPVGEVWSTILSAPQERNVANIINNATVLYLSGLAVAVGFRMNLFNIGVDGQYRVAAFTAAVVAGEAWLPGYLNTALAIVCAMAVGALWAGIAGVLRATRGVSEVISTIMLNAIATGLVAYLLRKVAVREPGSNQIGTKEIPEGSRIPAIPFGDLPNSELYGFLVIAVFFGFLYWFILNKTRFGFDLRATGTVDDSGGRERHQRHEDDYRRDVHLGRHRGLGGAADPVRRRLQLRVDLPVRARLRGHRDRPAGPQQPVRHRHRRLAVRLPGRAVQQAADPGRRVPGHRGHHPGSHRAHGGHQLRGRPPLRHPHRATERRQGSR